MKKIFFILVIFISANAFAQQGWIQLNSGTNEGLNTVYFLNAQTGFASGGFNIYKTTNGGNSWLPKVLPDTTFIYSIRFLNQLTGYASGGRVKNNNSSYQYIFKTTNTGENWIRVYNSSASFSQEFYYDIFPFENDVYVAHGGYSDFYGSLGSVLKSTNGGTTISTMMSSIGLCFDNLSFINSLTGWVSGNFFSDTPVGIKNVYRTNNGGINWTLQYSDSLQNMGSSKTRIQFINLNAGFGLYKKHDKTCFIKTMNGGLTWDTATYQHQSCNALFFANENTGWIGGGWNNDSTVILRTTDSGNNWHIQKKGFFNILSIYFINNMTGWAVGSGGVIFKTITGGVTGIQNISSEIPSKYSLSQNYPNPFNPITKIKFDVASNLSFPNVPIGRRLDWARNPVTIKVYDVMGREIQTLVNEKLQAGSYETTFDGSGLTSGVYFYRLMTDNFTETKRMLMLK